MSISALSSAAAAYTPPVPPVPAVKDNDGDNDNGAPEVKAATPPGVGAKLDIKA